MEVFTVSVGIGRVAISVRQTRQVVSRLHAEIYHELGSMPIIISVLRYQGSRRYVAVPGGFPPIGPYMYGPLLFKLSGLAHLERP